MALSAPLPIPPSNPLDMVTFLRLTLIKAE
jgi:hypothetical protein